MNGRDGFMSRSGLQLTWLPSRSLSAPSTTTCSPTFRPVSIETSSPSVTPQRPGAPQPSDQTSPRTPTILAHCWMAAAGTTVAACLTSNRRRAFTNWLGNSDWSAFGNMALSRTVPVVWSIWLSTVARIRGQSSPSLAIIGLDGQVGPRGEFVEHCWQAVSGMVNTTAIGCSCVITTSPVVSLVCTMLPGSIWRNPIRPLNRRGDTTVSELRVMLSTSP